MYSSVSSFSDDSGYERGVGLSNPQLGQGQRKMLDLVNKLHSTGVQVDIDLPQIAVIGAQSAGKSSLIESISGITLPRAAGTCTRCPTECRLSRSDSPWKCVVSLRFTTDLDGQPLGQARNEPFGPVIYKKEEVEDRIRRAQKAILNPSKSAKSFLEEEDVSFETDFQKSELTFSHNCVSLQISGPDVADLSFCDLPGLIASVSGSGSHGDIELVQSLITSYIKKTSCIILLTVACETDFENQGAHHLAKKYDPDGKRTIGVLTKPDRIPTGEAENWVAYIRNEKEPLDNNWFCVKQPSSNELKEIKTWSAARNREHEWFSATSPWCELDSVHQKYLRTGNLVMRLSSVLSDLISKRLPEIHQELERTMQDTQTRLSRLPREPASDPRSAICTLLHEFMSDLKRHIEGVPDDPDADEHSGLGLIQTIRPVQERFRRAIRDTAPNFRPFERRHAKERHLGKALFLRSEEGQLAGGEASDDDFEGEASNAENGFKSQKARSKGGLPSIDGIVSSPRGQKRKQNEVVDTRIYIDDVMERAQKARTRELPGHYPFVVQQTFIENIMKEWEEPTRWLCNSVYTTIDNHLKQLVSKIFSGFGQGHLEQRVRAIIRAHLKRCLETCERQVMWLLRLEARPFSLNTHYLEDYRAKFIAHYRSARDKYDQSDLISKIQQYKPGDTRSSMNSSAKVPGSNNNKSHTQTSMVPQPTGIEKVLIGLAEIGLQGIKAEDLLRLIPSDPMEPALSIMADVRAYFQVAYKRFSDNIPIAIDYEMVQGAERGLLLELYDGLGINGPDGIRICEEFATESPHIASQRMDLVNKYKRLESANQELLSIGL
ncbi:P-loop containing nucleoside triphosphate hydrolase protein [Panaeolus papilionaceus]|nr:P-loop containing nucleoside triphosphate hydrolase protein [Panaeolus papilionaceus]